MTRLTVRRQSIALPDVRPVGRAVLTAWRSLLRRARLLASYLLALSGAGLVIAGIAAIYAPAGLIVGGLALLAILTFDPTRAGRLTWPR